MNYNFKSVEKRFSIVTFLLALLTLILSFIPVADSVVFNAHDTYYVAAHREALWFYAGFTAVIGVILYLWHSYTTFYSKLLAGILVALVITFLLGIILTAYFSNAIGLHNDWINLVSTYSIIAIIGLTPVYVIVKLTLFRKS